MSKKILLLINSITNGGAEKFIKTLYEELSKDGYEIELLALEKNEFNKLETVKCKYLINRIFKKNSFRNFINLPFLAYRLFQYVKKNNVKIVQSHLFRSNYVNILSKILFKSNHHIQIVNHSIISRYKKNGVSGLINLTLIKKLYPFADKIISVSKKVQEDMLSLYNLKNKKEVIFNMFDIDIIKQKTKEEVKDFKFESKKKYLISIGRLISLKRNQDLIYAISKLDQNIHIIFLGQGPEEINLIKIAKKLGVLERIHILGWAENPYKYLYRSDVLISTSDSESFGRVIIEAMICGIPVISSRSGGPEEIIKTEINGLLYNVGDINTLAQKISLILNEKNLINKIVLNANKNLEKFNKYTIMSEYKKIIDCEL